MTSALLVVIAQLARDRMAAWPRPRDPAYAVDTTAVWTLELRRFTRAARWT